MPGFLFLVCRLVFASWYVLLHSRMPRQHWLISLNKKLLVVFMMPISVLGLVLVMAKAIATATKHVL